MEKKSYSDLLKDPRWQKKRLQVMERDNFACNLCGDQETTLHIHHKSYEKGKKPWESPLCELTTVCEDCHMVLESFKSSGTPFPGTKILKIKINSDRHFFIDTPLGFCYVFYNEEEGRQHCVRIEKTFEQVRDFITSIKLKK